MDDDERSLLWRIFDHETVCERVHTARSVLVLGLGVGIVGKFAKDKCNLDVVDAVKTAPR